jgi:hypothetical protein
MAFVPYKGVPDDAAEFEVAVIANSQTLTVGDAIVPAATGHTKAVTGAASSTTTILGVVTAILSANYGFTGLQSVAAGASNETTPVYYVQYLPTAVPGVKYKATLSQAAGTTTNSNGIGSFNMYSVNGKLDETSIALFSATEKQFVSLGLDPSDTANLTVIGYWGKTLTA